MSYRTVEVEVEDPSVEELIDESTGDDERLIDVLDHVAGCLSDRSLRDLLNDAIDEMTAIRSHHRYTPTIEQLRRECGELRSQNVRLCQMVRDLRSDRRGRAS